jgi:FixJ family two-component response regulator
MWQKNKKRESVSGVKELVCVVDDDQSVRRGLRRLLKSAGHAAETFASAEDHLAREIFEGPICLVLDVRMPGLKGLELQNKVESR